MRVASGGSVVLEIHWVQTACQPSLPKFCRHTHFIGLKCLGRQGKRPFMTKVIVRRSRFVHVMDRKYRLPATFQVLTAVRRWLRLSAGLFRCEIAQRRFRGSNYLWKVGKQSRWQSFLIEMSWLVVITRTFSKHTVPGNSRMLILIEDNIKLWDRTFN